MPEKSKIYIAYVVAVGLLVLSAALSQWQCADRFRYISYLALAIAGSTLKLRIPGITGTFSLTFLFVLIGIAELSFAETVTLACASIVVQCLWKAKPRPMFIQVLFNVCNQAISAGIAYVAFHTALGYVDYENLPALVALAAFVYFAANTLLVSVVLSFVESKPVTRVWEHWIQWSFPFYLVGTTAAALISMSNRYAGWETSLLALPLLYLVYRCYRLRVENQMGAGR